jgi:hypothetical protein
VAGCCAGCEGHAEAAIGVYRQYRRCGQYTQYRQYSMGDRAGVRDNFAVLGVYPLVIVDRLCRLKAT